MDRDVVTVARALDFSARKHAAQRRKGRDAEPYVNHLAEVALLLAEATGGADVTLVVAGLLHDTIEDTDATPEEITREFGASVASVVAEVTDDKSLPRQTRKNLQVETAASKSTRARLIKIADKISNLRSIAASPPLGWGAARKRAYFEWARAVADRCRGANRRLDALFDAAYAQGLAAIAAGRPPSARGGLGRRAR
jgi:guanosine-3',5'-bis(diphosphate) 3'-pyrophosphohydrolase